MSNLVNPIAEGVGVFPVRTPTLPPATHTNVWVLGDHHVIVVDPETPKRVESERMKTKSRNCIFEGVSLTGEVETTIVAGMVYETD